MIDMLELLSFPEIRDRAHRISIETYHRMIEAGEFDEAPVELVDGVIIEKMSKSDLHILLVDYLVELLRDHCPRNEFWVRKEDPITTGRSEPEPDVSIIDGPRPGLGAAKPTKARFVIEVAIHSLTLDRAKAAHYAEAGVSEYWIVRPEARKIEVYRNPAGDSYETRLATEASETLSSSALPGFEFNLDDALKLMES